MGACRSCDSILPDGVRFCPACGTAVAEDGPQRRRLVTVLFADMVGSTQLGERLDPELLRSVQSRFFAALREPIERHGGTIEKYIGDAIMAVFGIPAAHEDDGLRAVRAATELRPALSGLGRELQDRYDINLEIRVGLNTGEVIVADGSTTALATGDAVNTAARLEGAAQPGEILIGAATYDLVRDAVTAEVVESLRLRGKTEPITAYRLFAITGTEAHSRRWDTPTVGRDNELEVLDGALEEAVRTRAARLVTVVAPAGVGKSRLIRAFTDGVSSRARVLRGRCLPYGDGITYWAAAEIVRAAVSISDTESPDAIAAAITATFQGDPEASRLARVLSVVAGASTEVTTADDIAWAFRRLLERLGDERPLIVVIEDIHWADAALLDLLESVASWSDRVPILIVCPSRPELFERRARFAADLPNASTIVLGPLHPSAAGDLIDALPGGSELPQGLRRRVIEAAEGNPLFVEEMIGKLVDDGLLTATDGRWRVATTIDRVEIPLSISALLAARIDSLDGPERAVAERASVVGRVFERAAVVAISPETERGSAGGRLLTLTQKQFIRPDGAGLGGDDAFRFRHILIRDAAYDRLTKADRADLHAGFAAWLEAATGDRISAYIEIVAHHLWAAVHYRLELGSLGDADGLVLAAHAIDRLVEAADHAERIYAYDEAARLLGRTIDLLARIPTLEARDERDPLDLLARQAEALARAGDGLASIDIAREAIRSAEHRHEYVRASLLRERLSTYLLAQGDEVGALAAIEAAGDGVPIDPPTAARATVLATWGRLLMLVDRPEQAISVCDEAIAVAAVAGSPTALVNAQISKGTALANLGQTEVGLALLTEARDTADAMGDGYALGRAYINMSVAVERKHDPDLERAIFEQGNEVAARYGLERSLGVNLLMNQSLTETWEGHPRIAQRLLQQALDTGPVGDSAVWANTLLGMNLRLQGRLDESEAAFRTAGVMAARGVQQGTLALLAVERALIELLRGRWDNARLLFESARPALEADTRLRPILALEIGLIELDGTMARTARTRGDALAAAAAVVRVEATADRARALVGGVGARSPRLEWKAETHLALLDGLVLRGSGGPAVEAWKEAIGRLRELRSPWFEAQACVWLVEHLVEDGQDAGGIASAIASARTAAEAAEAEGLLGELNDLEMLSRGRAGRR
jgi:class 3 adenylate cyclase/tetratricopeptide (TPR) repeat protein